MLLQSNVRAVGAALATGLLLASTPASAMVRVVPAPVSRVIAFGDSLSDTGNFLTLTAGLPLSFPTPLPQAGDYSQGRFSNGAVAVERLANGLGVALQNYAYGGAKSGTDGLVAGTGLQSQVGMFANSLRGVAADPNALYFVWGGANDLRDITPATFASTIASTINNLTGIVGSLYQLGARNFLLPNLPDIGLTPEARSGGPGVMGGATFASEAFNNGLAAAYGALAGSLTGEHFSYVDIMAAQRTLTAGSPGNGFSNVSEGCFTGYVGVPGTQCADASGYLYWDKIHPSAATHAVLGGQMLAAVPEPQTLLMMAVGGLLLLGVARRRQG
jgi:phospholipase/lecithinase/hemolysin